MLKKKEEKQMMNIVTIQEAVDSLKTKYEKVKEIWLVSSVPIGPIEESNNIYVYTTDAKVWVDLPERHEGFPIKMIVRKKSS